MMNFFKKIVKKTNGDALAVPEIVVNKGSGSVNESFNRLKDNVIYYSDNGKNKVIQIESSTSGEGKSTLTVNLAITLAKSIKKVVIVDLDFRRPKMHKTFNIPNFNGIVEYMLDECDEEKLIKHTEYGVDVVNRGKSAYNASIIFTSDKFKALIEDLKSKYDIVLFDCPPVLQVSDYMYIAKLSDAVLFVVSCGMVHRSQVKEAIGLLRRDNVSIIGSVITFSNNNKLIQTYGSYYKYYNKYYGSYIPEK